MKKCIDCNLDKPLTDFYKRGSSKKTGKIWYCIRCKKCENHKFKPPSGKPNPKRFKKGHVPWNTGLVVGGNCRTCKRCIIWKSNVFERDNNECQHCFSKEKLIAHHIKSWNEFPELRFDIDNGLTVCRPCHARIHLKEIGAFQKGATPWIKGRKHSDESKRKMSYSLKGRVAWNKGIKTGLNPWNKGIKTGLVPVNAFEKGHIPKNAFPKGHVPWNKGLKKEINNGD